MADPTAVERPHRRVTLRDVARVAGVSEPTASRSLRGDPQISARTRTVVERVADQLGYLPNATARNLATRSSQTLGLMVPDVTDPVHGQIVAGFEQEASRHGYVLLVSNFRYDAAIESRGLRTLLSNQAQGVAVFGGVLDPPLVRSITRGAYVVFVGPENLSGLDGFETASTITADDAAGITDAVEMAVGLGYRRFGYLNGPTVASSVRRRNAARLALERHGLERLRVYEYEDLPIETVCSRMVQDERDLILCFDDQRALRLLSALRESGVRVPAQVGVIGFDDIPFAAISNPPLSTVSVPYEEMGRLACRMLLEQTTSGVPQPTVAVDVRVVLRGTTTPVEAPAHA